MPMMKIENISLVSFKATFINIFYLTLSITLSDLLYSSPRQEDEKLKEFHYIVYLSIHFTNHSLHQTHLINVRFTIYQCIDAMSKLKYSI